MQISNEKLEEFKILYKKRFGKDISDQEALESATKLLTLMKIIYRPIKKSDLEDLNRRRETTDRKP